MHYNKNKNISNRRLICKWVDNNVRYLSFRGKLFSNCTRIDRQAQ